MPYKDPQKQEEYFKRYRKEVAHKYYWRAYRKKKRIELLLLLGGKCMKCGFHDLRILQVDHINGNGYKERQESSSSYDYWYKILQKVKKGSKDYQLLCPNCNWIKRVEKREFGGGHWSEENLKIKLEAKSEACR
jgi:ssDNA-binding Zn-finger/Zn-ribbon topoisomerase 1